MDHLTKQFTQPLINNVYGWFSPTGTNSCIQTLSDNSVLNIANDINSVFSGVKLDGFQVNISLPRLVVVGTQSSGKSSVLNRIIGMDILPTGKNMVTRTPLELRLHKTVDTKGSIQAGYYTESGQWVVDTTISINTPTPTKEQMVQISTYIKNRTVQLAGDGMDVCDKPIILEVYSPHVPNLSLIDLPGLTMVACEDKGQPADIRVRIEKLVSKYICEPNTIVLTVIHARPDIETDLGLALVKSHDREGKRTVGVLTKPDLMNQGTHVGDYLIGGISKNLMLTYGYFSVMNGDDELEYFRQHNEYSKDVYSSRVGLTNLTNNLCKILVSSINDLLPSVIRDISKLEEHINKKLEVYGEGIPTTRDGKIHMLNRYVSDFTNCFLDCTESRATDINTGKKIKDCFIAYKSRMSKIQPFTSNGDVYNKQYFDNVISGLEGNHMAFHTSPVKLVEACFADKKLRPLFNMSTPTLNCVNIIHQVLLDTVNGVLQLERFSKFPLLVSHLTTVIEDKLLTPHSKDAKQKVIELLRNEEAYIWTDNLKFIDSLSECSVVNMDLKNITTLLNSYYSSINEVVCHSVPKIIMKSLVRSTQEGLLPFLISSTVNEGNIGLLEEDSGVDKQRKYYTGLRDKIASVKRRMEH